MKKTKIVQPKNPKYYEALTIIGCTFGLMACAGGLFVVTALLAKPFVDAVAYFNDSLASKPWSEWSFFWLASLWVGFQWVMLYLGLKIFEKLLMDRIFKQSDSLSKRK